MCLTTSEESAACELPGAPLGACARWLLGWERRPSGETSVATLGAIMVINAPPLFTPLTTDELVSLERISGVTTDVLIPVTHVETLLGAGYVQHSVSGLALTDLGVRRLDRERVKKEPN